MELQFQVWGLLQRFSTSGGYLATLEVLKCYNPQMIWDWETKTIENVETIFPNRNYRCRYFCIVGNNLYWLLGVSESWEWFTDGLQEITDYLHEIIHKGWIKINICWKMKWTGCLKYILFGWEFLGIVLLNWIIVILYNF